MQSEWDDFVADALDWMRDAPIRDEAGGFSDEEALTLYLATGLREVFRGHFGLTSRSVSLCDHVVFRNGPTPEDQRAWTACIENKRIPVHGIDYVPDILIRLAPGQQRPVLPLEGAQMILNLRSVPSGPWFFEESQNQGLQTVGRCAGEKRGSPDIKVGRSPGRSDQELCDLGRNRLIHGFFWDLPEQYFLASVDGRLRRPRSGWGACSAAAKSRRKVFNLWLLLDDRWAGDTAQVEPVR